MGTISQPELYRLLEDAGARRARRRGDGRAHARLDPQRRGAKMLFFEGARRAGTVGGGCIEAEVWAEAREALRTGRAAPTSSAHGGRGSEEGHGLRRHDGIL